MQANLFLGGAHAKCLSVTQQRWNLEPLRGVLVEGKANEVIETVLMRQAFYSEEECPFPPAEQTESAFARRGLRCLVSFGMF